LAPELVHPLIGGYTQGQPFDGGDGGDGGAIGRLGPVTPLAFLNIPLINPPPIGLGVKPPVLTGLEIGLEIGLGIGLGKGLGPKVLGLFGPPVSIECV
tara:strand:+ start:129 stop:422 length:294 start_codon:yes stop_codon:yes gene_type:complete